MNRVELITRAQEARGCFSHLRTTTCRRRNEVDTQDPFVLGDPFHGDMAKILCSKAHRNMGSKTQVFTGPENAMIRTRAVHVNEVVAISAIAADLFGLNTSLITAAAHGHDIGHVPLGHQGEAWIARMMNKVGTFCHEKFGVIVAQKIERCGKGLNLSFEVLDAMLRHSGDFARAGMSPEAWVLRWCDKIAYLFHDPNDIQRTGFALPQRVIDILNMFGANQRERTTAAIAALIVESAERGTVSFESSEAAVLFRELRTEMYQLYGSVAQQDVSDILWPVLSYLDNLRIGDPYLLLALMNDRDVFLIRNTPMRDSSLIGRTSLKDIIPHLGQIGPVDMCDVDLDW